MRTAILMAMCAMACGSEASRTYVGTGGSAGSVGSDAGPSADEARQALGRACTNRPCDELEAYYVSRLGSDSAVQHANGGFCLEPPWGSDPQYQSAFCTYQCDPGNTLTPANRLCTELDGTCLVPTGWAIPVCVGP